MVVNEKKRTNKVRGAAEPNTVSLPQPPDCRRHLRKHHCKHRVCLLH
ncbi:hypothetical protein WDL1CHR_03561 [Variovorax sp. WDL1]|nr:hypothetical protein CHC07_00732 [Variovorax sp. B4]PNG61202.1 hypothetical protein CHC06_01103 [Variovorax sp. B2]VTV12828.1 hypothetical protein WDL1CHR_03561 [Variovorax sp. WDL1]